MHYLGNGGWLIRHDGIVVATAPFVSNPAGLAVYWPSTSRRDRIDARVPAMPDVKIMLIGHSHYDHAMDLPYILDTQARNATLYGSTTARHLLGPTVGAHRVIDVSGEAARGLTPGRWVEPAGSSVRFMPLTSTHAPHVLGFVKVVSWSGLENDVAPSALPTVPAAWPEGETLAVLIDFMKDGKVVFRVYYQDAAAHPGQGIVPALAAPDDARVDVAILCVAAFAQVPGNPEGILGNTRPRYVVGGHWEDFFLWPSSGDAHRPAPGTSLDEFLERAHRVTRGPIVVAAPGQTLTFPVAAR